jgi:hypothetical protein
VIRSWSSLIIGLGIPAMAILVGTTLVSDTDVFVAGIPLLFFWMFCCFPLTTLCLWISWRFFDRRHYPVDVRTSNEPEATTTSEDG